MGNENVIHIQWDIIQLRRKVNFADELIELEKIILSGAAQTQKDK